MQRNAFNQPVVSETTPLDDQPCYVQKQVAKFVANDKLAAIASYLILLPKGTDVLEQDYITSVVDRRGNSLFKHRLRLTAVVERETHIECVGEEYT